MTTESFVPSVEAISHQVDDKLFLALAEAFENNTSPKQLAKIIPDIISEHTGILTEFHVDDSDHPNAWVYPPDLNKNHPFYNEFARSWYSNEDAAKLFRTERAKVLTASIDRKTSMVSGPFTKVVCPIYVSKGLLSGTFAEMRYDSDEEQTRQKDEIESRVQYGTRFTAKEVAAIVMHEIGHVFSYFESLADTITTNWVIDAATQALFKTDDQVVRIQVVRDVEDVLQIKLGDATKVADGITDPESFHVLVLSECEKASRSRLGAHIYDLRSWESASDQFASRHGASLSLATALDKMYRLYGVDDRYGKIVHWIGQIVQTLTVLGLILAAIASIVFKTAFAVVGMIYLLLVTLSAFINPFDDIYDPHKFRLGRIRQDVISRLKTHNLPKEYVVKTIKELDQLETILKDVQHHETLWRKIWVFCSSSTRKQRDRMTVQQELELLANNELFITAARLRVLV